MVRAFFRHILNNFQVAVRQPIARFVPFFTPVVTPSKPAPKNRSHTATLLAVFVALVSVVSVAGVFSYTRGGASAAANNNLNFQGRLLSSTGSVVPDGSYNIEFNLYTQQAPGGTTEWTEDYLVSATQGVTIKNGYFSVNLGSINPFPTTIAWDQQQYLGMKVQGTTSCTIDSTCSPLDAEMTPRFQLTAVPYAFRAAKLMDSTNTNAFTADDLIQKAPTLAQALNSANAAIRLNQSGAGGLLQLQNSGSDVFTVDNTGGTTIKGAVLAKNTADSNAAFDVQDSSSNSFLKVDTLGAKATLGSSAGSATTVLQSGTGGMQITSGSNVSIGTADTTGTLFVLDTKNTAGDPVGVDGAMYYNSSLGKLRCFQNGFWVDCIGGMGAGSSASASFISGRANVPANTTALSAERFVFTSATGVSNTAGAPATPVPANGSFRSCLVKTNAAITGGTANLRWTVNGVEVGSPVCQIDSTTNRNASSAIDSGVVPFTIGDDIGVAFDTVGLAPTTVDFTVYWTVEFYATSGSGIDLQYSYNQSGSPAIITTTDAKDLKVSLADTATDANMLVDIATGSTGRFAVQNNGTDIFGVSTTAVTASGDLLANGNMTLGDATTDRLTINSELLGSDALVFQGATDNSFATKFQVADPTANNTIIVPDAGGTLAISASGNLQLSAAGDVSTKAAVSFGTSVTSPSFTGTGAVTLSSGGAAGLTLDSASNIVSIDSTDTTLQRIASGGYSLELNDSANTTFNIINTDGTAVAGLSIEGGVSAASFTGDGSALSNLSAANLSGTINDARLSGNVVLLTGTQTLTGAKTFSAGLNVSSGNVAIGLSGAPSSLLSVGGTTGNFTVDSTGYFTASNGALISNGTLLLQRSSGGATMIIDQTGVGGKIGAYKAESAKVGLFYDDTGAFSISRDTRANISAGTGSGTDVLIADASGNVGIGLSTQTPGALFAVGGTTGNFLVDSSGAVGITASSTTALLIKDTSGTGVFGVDSSGNIVRVGDATADGTGTVLVLDTKNTSGDPTGGSATDGAQYYNSAWEQYRCYRDSTWETCGLTPVDRAFSLNDEFLSGYTGGACTTATAIVGNQNWSCFVSGTATTAYNIGAILPTADHPGIMRMTTGATNGNGFTMALAGNNSGSVVIAPQNRVQATVGQGATITNNRLRVGLHAETTTNIRPVTGVWWEADRTTNVDWQYCFGTGVAATCASSGIPITASTLYSLDIQITATGAGTSEATFRIDGTSFTVTGVTISTAARVNPAISCFNSTGAARECYVDYFQFSGVAAARR